MDRTEEFRKVAKIYIHSDIHPNQDRNGEHDIFAQEEKDLSPFVQIALRVSHSVNATELLLPKMKKLSERKEFSNDPTNELEQVSSNFHDKTVLVQKDLQLLKQLSETMRLQPQHTQHYTLITQTLTKILTTQVQAFKKYAAVHAENLKQRQSRVSRYGLGESTTDINIGSSFKAIEQQQQQYAMFNNNFAPSNPIASFNPNNNNSNSSNSGSSSLPSDQQALRRRANPSIHKSPYISDLDDHSQKQQSQVQLQKERFMKENRLSNSQKIETTVAQMGELFTQLTTLVMQQGEQISRIEDDVEIGLDETKKAHVHMEKFYEISKGNRSMILKIFALLVFFIFLFLKFT